MAALSTAGIEVVRQPARPGVKAAIRARPATRLAISAPSPSRSKRESTQAPSRAVNKEAAQTGRSMRTPVHCARSYVPRGPPSGRPRPDFTRPRSGCRAPCMSGSVTHTGATAGADPRHRHARIENSQREVGYELRERDCDLHGTGAPTKHTRTTPRNRMPAASAARSRFSREWSRESQAEPGQRA